MEIDARTAVHAITAERARSERAAVEALIARLDAKPATPIAITSAIGTALVAWLTGTTDLSLAATITGWAAVATGGTGLALLVTAITPRTGGDTPYGPLAYARMTPEDLVEALYTAAAEDTAAADINALYTASRIAATKTSRIRWGMHAILYMAAPLAIIAAITA